MMGVLLSHLAYRGDRSENKSYLRPVRVIHATRARPQLTSPFSHPVGREIFVVRWGWGGGKRRLSRIVFAHKVSAVERENPQENLSGSVCGPRARVVKDDR